MKKILAIVFFVIIISMQNVFAVNYEQIKSDAIMLYSVNKIQEAKNLFEQVPEENRDAETYLLLSNIAQDQQDIETAKSLLYKAIEKNPKFYKPYYNLANMNFYEGNIDEALKLYKKALWRNRKNSYIDTNIACCYLAKKNLTMAKIYFNKAATLNPNNPNNYYNLAYIYKEKGNNKKAEKLLQIYNKLMQERIN